MRLSKIVAAGVIAIATLALPAAAQADLAGIALNEASTTRGDCRVFTSSDGEEKAKLCLNIDNTGVWGSASYVGYTHTDIDAVVFTRKCLINNRDSCTTLSANGGISSSDELGYWYLRTSAKPVDTSEPNRFVYRACMSLDSGRGLDIVYRCTGDTQ